MRNALHYEHTMETYNVITVYMVILAHNAKQCLQYNNYLSI